ncbi:MAG: FMN-binding protein [Planctomycetota bacterium]|nr:FMN-binding protein [Planctomycetota bacterium]
MPLVRPSGSGKVFLTADEALALAFPKCEVARETVYLTDAQKQRVSTLAGSELDGSIARPWTARREGKVIGTAYLDTHKVRTLKETLFVVVDPEGRVVRTEVLAFAEPEEYLPRARWYEAFQGRALDEDLRVKRAIRPVTGASLTVAATTEAVRRVLALHKVLGEPKPKP